MGLGTMRTLILIWLFYVENSFSEDKRILVKTYPKKVKPSGKLLFVNSGKILKTKQFNTKKPYTDKQYTAFEGIGEFAKKIDVPSSPYFPLERTDENKPRVKKVLPDYTWTSLRNKRSVSNGDDVTKKARATNAKKTDSQKVLPRKTHEISSKNKNTVKHKNSKLRKQDKRTNSKHTKKPSKRSKRNKQRKLQSQTHNKREKRLRKGNKSNKNIARKNRGKGKKNVIKDRNN